MSEKPKTNSTVTLGEVAFDPVAIQDFRLSVEGTSGTGKSNTLAVVLEDLADVTIPTLIIERLGALSTVRLEDEDIVVVGARKSVAILDAYRSPPLPSECSECGGTLGTSWTENDAKDPICFDCAGIDPDKVTPE